MTITRINNPIDVLYNSSGTNGSVALSKSAANYEHMRIYYRTNDSWYGSVDVYAPNGKSVALMGYWTADNDNYIQFKERTVHINGTSISTSSSNRFISLLAKANQAISSSVSNDIYITRVEAWN